MVHCTGSITQGQETFSPGNEAAGAGAAAKTKPCVSTSTPVPAAPAVEHKDNRAGFWYEPHVHLFQSLKHLVVGF